MANTKGHRTGAADKPSTPEWKLRYDEAEERMRAIKTNLLREKLLRDGSAGARRFRALFGRRVSKLDATDSLLDC